MLWAKKKGARTPQEPNDPKTPSNWIQATNPFLRGQLKSSQTYPVQCSLPIRLPLLLLLLYPPTLPTKNYITDSVITHKTHPLKMAMFTPSPRGADNFAGFHSRSHKTSLSTPRTTPILFFNNKLHHSQLHSFPSLKFRVLCSIKEKENIKETDKVTPGVLTGLRVDDLDQSGSGPEESGSGKVGSDWDWPPWQNIPERYKLIGTTSLAFVICNMDKVL